MAVWGILGIIFLIIVIGALLTGNYLLMKKNQASAVSAVIKPFGVQFNMKNPTEPISLVSSDGTTPQISCPIGTKPNIIGAWTGVIDPMGRCYPNGPADIFTKYCTQTDSNKKICTNPSSFLNKACNSKYTGSGYMDCRTRDVSAYFTEECNSQNSNECSLTIDPSKDKWFGPYPCNISPSDSANYTKLPLNQGWKGGKSTGSGKDDAANMSQGYYVHGIYTCVPK